MLGLTDQNRRISLQRRVDMSDMSHINISNISTSPNALHQRRSTKELKKHRSKHVSRTDKE